VFREKDQLQKDLKESDKIIKEYLSKIKTPQEREGALRMAQADLIKKYMFRMDNDTLKRAKYTINWIFNSDSKFINPSLTLEDKK
jgi:hypothetical protein